MKKDLTEAEIEKEVEDAREKICETNWYGPYGHNVIGFVLSGLASRVGVKYANQLIEEFDLEDELGIRPVEEDE